MKMNLLIFVVIAVALIAVLALANVKQTSRGDGLSFESRGPLFSPAERSFLGVLDQTLDGRYRVFGKVRLGDMVKPAKGLSNSKRATAQNKLNQKHIDFVVCSASNLAVVGVVELDDKSHGREDRVGRDLFVDQALAGANIPIAHFPAKKGYQIQEVQTKLAETLKLQLGTVNKARTEDTPQIPQPDQVSARILTSTPNKVVATEPEPAVIPLVKVDVPSPSCPKCGAMMVKRRAHRGPYAGKFFWACSSYPKCRQVSAVEDAGV
jgi:hypothetical protein